MVVPVPDILENVRVPNAMAAATSAVCSSVIAGFAAPINAALLNINSSASVTPPDTCDMIVDGLSHVAVKSLYAATMKPLNVVPVV